ASDVLTWERVIQKETAEQRERAKACLSSVQQYCHGLTCRHKYLVEYFGQEFSKTCQACDICLGKLTGVADALRIGQIVLSCVIRCQEKFGVGHIAKVLVGSSEKKLAQFGHHRLSTWGLLKEHSRHQVADWIEQLLTQGYLKRVGEYSVLKVTDSGRELLKGQSTPVLVTTVASAAAVTSLRTFDSWEGVDRELFEELRGLRRKLAIERNVPSFIIFSDATLRDLARRRPTGRETLMSVHGIGDRKAEDFGDLIRDLIRRWCVERNIETDVEPVPKPHTPDGRSPGATMAFPMFDQGLSIEEVMERLGRAHSTVSDYLMQYIRFRKITDPNRWVEAALAQKIRIAIMYNDSGRLKPLFEAFHGQVDYETLRIVEACESNRRRCEPSERSDLLRELHLISALSPVDRCEPSRSAKSTD
ncbi:MAG TPA: RQC domain-containing protein, partial [Pirellulaceae bacterium]|nr:RQC domain-containing protein [Pirellulaceae bacterium]